MHRSPYSKAYAASLSLFGQGYKAKILFKTVQRTGNKLMRLFWGVSFQILQIVGYKHKKHIGTKSP